MSSSTTLAERNSLDETQTLGNPLWKRSVFASKVRYCSDGRRGGEAFGTWPERQNMGGQHTFCPPPPPRRAHLGPNLRSILCQVSGPHGTDQGSAERIRVPRDKPGPLRMNQGSLDGSGPRGTNQDLAGWIGTPLSQSGTPRDEPGLHRSKLGTSNQNSHRSPKASAETLQTRQGNQDPSEHITTKALLMPRGRQEGSVPPVSLLIIRDPSDYKRPT